MKKNLNLFLVLLASTLFFASCDIAGIEGVGDPVTEEFFLDDFDEFKIIGSFTVKLTQGEQQKVMITGQPNLLELINTDVSGDLWKIKYDRSVRSSDDPIVEITVPDLKAIGISGAGKVIGMNELDLDDLEISISGTGDIDLFGAVKKQDIQISGTCNIDNFDLISDETKIEISGTGDIETTAEEDLEVRIAGSGEVKYKGDPAIEFSNSGVGRLIDAN